MLGLRERHPTEGGSDVHGDVVGTDPARAAHGKAGVRHRQPSGCEPELAEAIGPAHLPAARWSSGCEVVDLGGDLRSECGGVEAVDPLDCRASDAQPGPEGVEPDPDRRDRAETGDPDPAPAIPHGGTHGRWCSGLAGWLQPGAHPAEIIDT